MSRGLAHALATVAGLGDRAPAPGTTVGSVLAVVLYLLAARWLALPGAALVGAAAALASVAVWACGAEAVRRGTEDPGPVVLDETAGQWLALVVGHLAHGAALPLLAVASLFTLFRVFDILKPWPVGRLEHLQGGLGIVADDLAAGVLAGLSWLLAVWLLG